MKVTVYAKTGDIIRCNFGIGLVLSTFVIRHAGLVGDVFINGKVKAFGSKQMDLDYNIQDDIEMQEESLPNVYFHNQSSLHFKSNTL